MNMLHCPTEIGEYSAVTVGMMEGENYDVIEVMEQ